MSEKTWKLGFAVGLGQEPRQRDIAGRAVAFLLLGLLSGSVIGLARMVAGSHFPSHVLWSGGFLYFIALLIAATFGFWRESGGRNGRDGSGIGKRDN